MDFPEPLQDKGLYVVVTFYFNIEKNANFSNQGLIFYDERTYFSSEREKESKS